MYRYAFKEFESCNEESYDSENPEIQYTLNDQMFKCYLHWYIDPATQIQKEKQALQNLAKSYNVVLCLWRILTEDGRRLSLIDLKGIENLSKLPDFLDHALQVSSPTYVNKRFGVLSICIINKFGSFEADKCYSMCEKCGNEEKLNECCGQFTCAKCSFYNEAKDQNCPYCHKELKIIPIPLQVVTLNQSRRIYEPMFCQLTLQKRFELMDMIECDFDYN